MNPLASNEGRRLVPRWRSLSDTLRANELSSIKVRSGEINDRILDLSVRIGRFQSSPNLITAAELVESAIISGKEALAADAARYLLVSDVKSVPLIRLQAKSLLGRLDLLASDSSSNEDTATNEIAAWRERTRLYPYDALAWVELSLQYTINNKSKSAKRAMIAALQLAPENRHVLRSASRMFLHQLDPERAHDTIWRCAASRYDPWLMSAEIALADVADRNPKLFKVGLRLLDDENLIPHNITELSGAIGTADLIAGSVKRSRRMFQRSMIDPSASALAQGEWATPRLGREVVSLAQIEASRHGFEAHEAAAFHYFRLGDYSKAIAECGGWSKVDPYSVRPFEFASTTAGLIEEFEIAIQLSDAGLGRFKHSPTLINAKAFALASLGRVQAAADVIKDIEIEDKADAHYLISQANLGLIALRRKDLENGARHYKIAIDQFIKNGQLRLAAQAKIYFAHEAWRAGDPNAKSLIDDARRSVVKYGSRTERLIFIRAAVEMGEIEATRPSSKIKTAETEVFEPLTPPQKRQWTSPGSVRLGLPAITGDIE